MKKYLFLVVALVLVGSLFGANTDRFYQGAVKTSESLTQITYTWTYTVPTEATDQMHSPAMFIGDANDNDGLVSGIVSAASDINITLHFSADGYTWFTAVVPAGLDATSNAVKTDTVGTQTGAADYSFRNAKWLIVEADYGSAACEAGEIVKVNVALRKDKAFVDSNGRMVKCGEVRTTRSYGWLNP